MSAGRRTVAVLFAREDSIYKEIRGCAVYDERRDARSYPALQVNSWWGHKAEKATLLYVCRVRPAQIPPVTVNLAAPLHTVGCCGRGGGSGIRQVWRPEISHADRERTPIAFARWLVTIARRVELGELSTAPAANTAAVLADRRRAA